MTVDMFALSHSDPCSDIYDMRHFHPTIAFTYRIIWRSDTRGSLLRHQPVPRWNCRWNYPSCRRSGGRKREGEPVAQAFGWSARSEVIARMMSCGWRLLQACERRL